MKLLNTGKLSNDGSKIVDKHSGYVININFDTDGLDNMIDTKIARVY